RCGAGSVTDDGPLTDASHLPGHVVARRRERRFMARVSLALLILQGGGIATVAAFNSAVAQHVATIWPLLALLFFTHASIVCAYFGAGAFENARIESLIGLVSGVAKW